MKFHLLIAFDNVKRLREDSRSLSWLPNADLCPDLQTLPGRTLGGVRSLELQTDRLGQN